MYVQHCFASLDEAIALAEVSPVHPANMFEQHPSAKSIEGIAGDESSPVQFENMPMKQLASSFVTDEKTVFGTLVIDVQPENMFLQHASFIVCGRTMPDIDESPVHPENILS